MPLTRLNESYRVDLEGIAFGMVDQNGDTVRCLVTDDALTDAIGGIPNQAEKLEWLQRNRGDVEMTAVILFDQNPATAPQLRIDSREPTRTCLMMSN